MLTISIGKKGLEKLTASLAVVLLTIMVFVVTLAMSNTVFKWDLFPPEIEKMGSVFMVASFLIISSSVIINLMVNIGRIAAKLDERK